MISSAFLTPKEAWERLAYHNATYYDNMSAMYTGDHRLLHQTGEYKSFWQRKSPCKIHVPIAADIASTSANLLFSREPTYTVYDSTGEKPESDQQVRMEQIIAFNDLANKLIEAAETCAALGDVYFKLRWNSDAGFPIIDVVQPDNAWPEYFLGELKAVHFFTILASDPKTSTVIRAHECYTRGMNYVQLFQGAGNDLGAPLSNERLAAYGYKPEYETPIDALLAVHIANRRPNRMHRSSMLGRSDMEGLRDLCDALDEAYSSLLRDIRLAKAKLIVPIEYLRKKPASMMESISVTGAWEFDPEVETYVAMDIDTDAAKGSVITASQPEIRSSEHLATCEKLTVMILTSSGYSPNSFGLNVDGTSVSGTALNIRERKSAITKNRKQLYWQYPLERILSAMVQLDAVIYPNAGSMVTDGVSISFPDSMGADSSVVASTIEALFRAQAISTVTKVRMQHPDWSEKQVADEVELINSEYGTMLEAPDALLGDLHSDDESDIGGE